MTEYEIYRSYSEAVSKAAQIEILAELNDVPKESIEEVIKKQEAQRTRKETRLDRLAERRHLTASGPVHGDALFKDKDIIKITIGENTPGKGGNKMPGTKDTLKVKKERTASKLLTEELLEGIIAGEHTISTVSEMTGVPKSTVSWHCHKYASKKGISLRHGKKAGIKVQPSKKQGSKTVMKPVPDKKTALPAESVSEKDILNGPDTDIASSCDSYIKKLNAEYASLSDEIDILNTKLRDVLKKKEAAEALLKLIQEEEHEG